MYVEKQGSKYHIVVNYDELTRAIGEFDNPSEFAKAEDRACERLKVAVKDGLKQLMYQRIADDWPGFAKQQMAEGKQHMSYLEYRTVAARTNR